MAEPLVLEQAGNVLKAKSLEVRLDNISYQSDQVNIVNSAGSPVMTLSDQEFIVNFIARYAFTPKIEASIRLPYKSIDFRDQPFLGLTTSLNDSGIADPLITGKYSGVFDSWNIAGYAVFGIPIGQQSKVLPQDFSRGLDLQPGVAVRKEMSTVNLNFNLSYDITGDYTDADKVKRNPGDVLSFGAGIEKEFQGINWCGEFIYSSLSDASTKGVTQPGSSGSRMDLIVGECYNSGHFKTKLGLDTSLGDPQYREYDYKVLLGVTYVFGVNIPRRIIHFYN